MTNRRWADGCATFTDSTHEDPLVYYLVDGEWATAIGFELAEDRRDDRRVLAVRILSGHLSRLGNMAPAARRTMLIRMAGIAGERTDASELVLDDSGFRDVSADQEVLGVLEARGLGPSSPDGLTWRRVRGR